MRYAVTGPTPRRNFVVVQQTRRVFEVSGQPRCFTVTSPKRCFVVYDQQGRQRAEKLRRLH